MEGDAIAAFARAHGLEPVDGDVRELTPMLVTGDRGSMSNAMEGELAPGLRGTLLRHVYAEGRTRRESAVVLTAIPESAAFVPALVCRDRRVMGGGAPAQLPAERWTETKLESEAFNRRYRLLTLAGQDAGWVRELFSPALVSWLIEEAPTDLSFELNQGSLAVGLPAGSDDDPERTGLLVAATSELATRIRAEAEEEEFDPDLFDESEEMAAIERALRVVSFERPPASAQEAVEAYRAVAARKPTVLLNAAFWALVGAAAAGALAWLLAGAFAGDLAAILAGVAAAVAVGAGAFPIARLVSSSHYHWGSAAVSRVGEEAFVREYARSRRLELRNRWRFHSDHRRLAMPGFAEHVLAGEVPAAEVPGLFVLFGDVAELRSRGIEMAYASDRPLASNALVVELAQPPAPGVVEGLELGPEDKLAVAGSQLIIWRPIQGNLLRTAAGSDRFRARVGELVRQVVDG